ncbi:phage replication protein O [Serratia fonticola AU-P3(3)]|nr:phage replication protein O [Serratia fonticola AU-P3(3)]
MGNVSNLAEAREARRPQESPRNGGKGFALLHRKIMELPFYRTDSEAVHLWVHIIMKANYEPTIVQTEIGDLLLRRGEFITGRSKLELETGVKDDRIKYLLNKFEKMGMITRVTNKKFTRIYIVKYDDYQSNSVPTECQQSANAKPVVVQSASEVVPTECQQSATANELNNNSLSKDKEMSSGDDQPAKKKSFKTPYQKVMETYNEVVGERLPNAEELNPKRKREIKRLLSELKEPSVEAARNYFLAFIGSAGEFYFGKNDRGWRASFDYLLRSETLVKTREGTL